MNACIFSNLAMCPMSYDLKNGDHEMIMNDSKPEYTMMMTCDEGYIMVGVKNFTCKKNGLWDRAPSATKCVGMYLTMYVSIFNYLYITMYIQ